MARIYGKNRGTVGVESSSSVGGIIDITDDGPIDTGESSPGEQRINGANHGTSDSDSPIFTTIDPESIRGNSGGESTGKRRGRPRGSGGSGGRKTTSKATIDLSAILLSLHLMGSKLVNAPEFELSEDESKQLAKAITNVSDQYDIPMFDDKTMAWIQLAMVGGSIYGPRAMAYSVNHSKKQKSPPGPVVVQ